MTHFRRFYPVSRFIFLAVLSLVVSVGVIFAYVTGTYSSGVYGAGGYGAGNTVAPTVSLTAPANGSTLSGASVAVTADASDDISIAGVQFKFDTNTNIGSEDTSSTYGVVWDTTAVADGSHTVIAVARDSSGNRATSSEVTVTIDNTAPVRSAGSPSGTLSLNTTETTISLTTNESATCKYSTSSGVAYGSMTSFSTTIGTSHSSTISGLSNGGSYVYYVKCQDGQGNTNATDYTISFTVAADTTSPTVTVTSPSNNATVSGTTVALVATATDDVSVSGVQFKRDANTNLGSEDLSSPYEGTWDSTSVSDGSHTIIAVARDSTGNYATSSVITITVDNTGPVISSISSGTPGSSSATITWTTDEVSDSQVDYGLTTGYGTSSTLNSTMTTSHSVSLTGLAINTAYHFRVRSTDAQGNLTVSSDQTFSTPADTTAPSVSVTAPSEGETVRGSGITISATASDNVSVAGVQFKLDTNTNIDVEDTTSGYEVTWDATTISEGEHTLIAVARDSSGNYATSSAVTIIVSNSSGTQLGTGTRNRSAQSRATPAILTGVTSATVPTPTASIPSTQESIRNIIKANKGLLLEAQARGIILPPLLLSLLQEVQSTVQGSTGNNGSVYNRKLVLEDRGNDVKALQDYIVAKNAGPAARALKENGTTHYFGPLTEAALVEYQVSRNVTATGEFDEGTRALVVAGK